MNHKDSMGYGTVIEKGGVQIISTGSGLFHEEYNIGDEEVNFLQNLDSAQTADCKTKVSNQDFSKSKPEE